jgi:metal-responsive CopG/Arc/MetJ family transcriptional regulator
VPNQRRANTTATSFTLPEQLLALVNRKAAGEMTNKSDIIRRALMNYLSPGERAAVQSRIAENSGSGVQRNHFQKIDYSKSKNKKAKKK